MRWWFFFVLLATSLWAQSDSERARCDLAIAQVQEAKLDMPEKGRLDMMGALADDLWLLREAVEKKNLGRETQHRWQKCFERKVEALRQHESLVSEGARTTFPYLMAMGKKTYTENNFSESYMYFKAAYESRHSEYAALSLYFRAWRRWRQLSLNQNPTLIEIDSYKKEATDILKKIIQHPGAGQAAQIEARLAFYHDLIRLGQEAPAMEELRAIVALDPKNKDALDRLSSFEIKRGRPSAARAYLEELKKASSLSREYFAKLIEIQLLQDSVSEALLTADEGLRSFPNDFTLQALKASALAMNGRLAEAKNLNGKLLKFDAKNQRLLDSQSRVLEKEGDLSRSQELPGKALAEYKTALDLSPSRLTLRIKMATLLFDYRRDQDFKPAEVTEKDMNEVVRLLLPTLESESPREDVLLLFLQSAKRSQASAQAVPTCDQLERAAKSYPTVTALLDCAEIYVKNGNPAAARRILEAALFQAKFAASKDRIKEAYRALKKP